MYKYFVATEYDARFQLLIDIAIIRKPKEHFASRHVVILLLQEVP